MKKKRENLIMCPLGLLACKAGKCRFYNKKLAHCEPRRKSPNKYSKELIFEK